MSLSAAQINALNSGNPNALALGAGVGTLLEELYAQVASGNLGISAVPWDVDALAGEPIDAAGAAVAAGSNRHFAEDADSHSGLDFGYHAGQVWVPGTGFVTVPADTIELSASSTNYVEVNSAGVVSKNTSAFSLLSSPLFVVVTGSSSITSVRPARNLMTALPSAGLPGTVMSAGQRHKSVHVIKGTLSATGTVKIHCPNAAARIVGIRIDVDTTLASDNTNYWTFSALNKGAAGSGTTALLDSGDTNTTKTTGGSGLTNYVSRALTLHGTAGNLVTAANDILIFTATKSASANDLVNFGVTVHFEIDG